MLTFGGHHADSDYMRRIALALTYGYIFAGLVGGQAASDLELAKRLADPEKRQPAVEEVIASGNARVRLLLSWARHSPAGLGNYPGESSLKVGLADIFGALKTREAIPFLIENIDLPRFLSEPIWLKSDKVIEERRPCASALIRIGSPAAEALMKAFAETGDSSKRSLLIFTLARIAPMTLTRTSIVRFLRQAQNEAELERQLAADGLKAIGEPDR